MTTDYDSVDYFTDPSLVPDPHPYYDHVRAKDPVCCPINNGVLAVTGWEAANAVYKDTENYSSCVAVMGPFTPIPFVARGRRHLRAARGAPHRDPDVRAHGHDGSAAPHRRTVAAVPAADAQAAEGERGLHVAAGRPPHRRVHRRRQVRVPGRIREAVLAAGRCRPARRARGGPRGVPRGLRRPAARLQHRRTRPRGDRQPTRWQWADEKFSTVHRGAPRETPRRRAHLDWPPRSTRTARRPRWSTSCAPRRSCSPPGQETTAKLLGAALRVLGDRPDIQQQLRDDRSLIPMFIEECLRMDSPVKSVFRMARKINDAGRHRGARGHDCDGQPRRGKPRPQPVRRPARVPARPQERPRAHRVQPRHPLLPGRTARARRGPGLASSASSTGWPTSRSTRRSTVRPTIARYTYEPTFILRGLTDINIKFTPAG